VKARPAGRPAPCPTPAVVLLHGERSSAPCRRRSCPSCGVLWLGDTRVRALAAAAEFRGAVALVTVTAPGADVLPWSPAGRVVAPDVAREWNESAPARWSRLHDHAAQEARRLARSRNVEWRLLMKAWEYQKRGVLHLHLVVPCATAGERQVSELYVSVLAREAQGKGFGFVDRGKLPVSGGRRSSRCLEAVSPQRAAGYVAAYLASTGAGKGGIAEVARAQGVPGPVFYVTSVLTRASGVTMRSLRDRRRVMTRYPAAGESHLAWHAACLLDAVERAGPRLTAGTRGALLARFQHCGPAAVVDGCTGEVTLPTPAAQPSGLGGGTESSASPQGVAVVRLDLVPHRDDAGGLPWVWRRQEGTGISPGVRHVHALQDRNPAGPDPARMAAVVIRHAAC
jgi:hypothetical protein